MAVSDYNLAVGGRRFCDFGLTLRPFLAAEVILCQLSGSCRHGPAGRWLESARKGL